MLQVASIIAATLMFGLSSTNPISFYNNDYNQGVEHQGGSEGFGGGNLHEGGGTYFGGGHESLNLASLQGSQGGYGGDSGGVSSGASGYYGGIAIGHGLEGHGGGNGGDSGASASQAEGGDFHHGVSIVGGGGKGQQTSFDLTHHGSDGHTGIFGGSFVVSGKHEGGHGGEVAPVQGGSSSGLSHLSHLGLGAFSGGFGGGHEIGIPEHY